MVVLLVFVRINLFEIFNKNENLFYSISFFFLVFVGYLLSMSFAHGNALKINLVDLLLIRGVDLFG